VRERAVERVYCIVEIDDRPSALQNATQCAEECRVDATPTVRGQPELLGQSMVLRRAVIAAVVVLQVLFVLAPLNVLAPVDPHHIGQLVLHGRLPYRDFQFEYPPGAVPLFLLPGLVPARFAMSVLALQALACEAALAWFVLRHHAGALWRWALGSLFVFPFLSGGFDAVPMLCLALATAALARGRKVGWWWAAIGTAVKLFPISVWGWAGPIC